MAKEYLHIASFDRIFSDECNVEGCIKKIQHRIKIFNLELLGLVSLIFMIFLTLITLSLKDFFIYPL